MSWENIALSEVAEVFNGKTPSKSEQRDAGYPVLKIKDVSDESSFKGQYDSFVDNELADKFTHKKIKLSDTLILNAAHNSDYVGSKQYCAEKEVVGALPTGEWLVARAKEDKLHSKFLNYWLGSSDAKFQIKQLVKGIHLYPKDVARLEIPLPPLEEQKRIATILDKADTIRRKRQQAIKLADEFLRAVFLDMFTSSKVKKFRKLGEVVKIVGGGTPSKSNSKYWGGTIPWVSVKDFTSKVIFTAQDFITEEGLKNSATNLIPKGTIIIPTRMALGKVAITGCDMTINQDLKALFLNHEDIAEVDFLIGFLETKASFIESNGKGATVKGVTLDFLRDIDVPVPDKNEQIKYANIRKKIFEMLSKHDAELSKNLFDALNQKVFTIN